MLIDAGYESHAHRVQRLVAVRSQIGFRWLTPCVFFLLSLWARPVYADRLISIPTGVKVLFKTCRAELLMDGGRRSIVSSAFAVGLTKDFDAEFHMDRLGSNRWTGTADVSYNFIPAVSDFLPGVSLGVMDIFDRSPGRRYAYIAATQRIGLDGDQNSGVPLEATVGFRFGRHSGAFVGASIPFTWQFYGLADHDGLNLRAGLEFRATRSLAVRWVTSSVGSQWSARWTARF